ncbi:MAG: hypothetical protein KF700_01695 [Hyphomonadaceae bacterium]|nr:hypothetical protein [Hyphomonadaceae bacterium]
MDGMIRTRLSLPTPPPGVVSRASTLGAQPETLLTVLSAPAGYGKTTLMAQWAAALHNGGGAFCWLTADIAMNAPNVFVRHLAEAASLEEAHSCEALMSALERRGPFSVFIDDLHLLSAPVRAQIMRLVGLSAPELRFIIGTRSAEGLTLARLRAQGAVTEIGASELKLSDDESAFFLQAAALSDNDARAMQARAQGWPAGLCLSIVAARAAGNHGRANAIADYFEEEVFAHLTDAERLFLTRVSVLDTLCAASCDAVTRGKDSRARLRRLAQAGFFLDFTDDTRTRYRLHPMFKAFLEEQAQELPGSEIAELHRRASVWLAETGELTAALVHTAKSGDIRRVADFLEANCEEMTYRGDIPVVARHAEALPREVLNQLPKTLLTLAWLTTRQLKFDETERLLEQAAKRIDALEHAGETPEATIALMRLMLKHRQTVLATARDDEMADVDSQSEDLLKELGDARPYLTCTLYSQMLTARYTQYRLDDFSRIEPSARSALTRSGYRFAAIGLQAALGAGLFHSGRTQAAREALEQALEEANRISGRLSGQAALAALPLSRILYEGDERERAEELIEGHLPVAREFGFSEQLHSGYLTLNRLRQAEGDIDGALRALDEGKRVALECNLARLSIGASTERIRIWLRTGRPDLALREGRREGLDVGVDDVSPRARSIQSDEIRAMAWTRLAVSRDRINEALTVTKRWRHFCISRGAIRTLVRWCILTAHICGARGDISAAKRVLHEGLNHAVEGRYLRSFIDEGPFIQKLIADGYAGAIDTRDPVEIFARDLLSRYPSAQHPIAVQEHVQAAEEGGMLGALNTREVEILRLVSCGLRNGEIGERLGLTEGTVKWYMQQIYDKVGVRRRPQAVERARQLGMLH